MKPSTKSMLQLVGGFLALAGLGFGLFYAGSMCSARKKGPPASSGQPSEILVVTDRSGGGRELPPAVGSIFQARQDGLNQPEAVFSLMILEAEKFEKFFKKHHAILLLEIKPGLPDEGITIEEDLWAAPQVVVNIKARNDSTLNKLLRGNRQSLLNAFYRGEYRRIWSVMGSDTSSVLSAQCAKTLGCTLRLPACFYNAKSGMNYLWARCKNTEGERSILLARLPFSDTLVLTAGGMTDLCDSLVTALIPGSRKGSSMKVYRENPLMFRQYDINGHFSLELRGLWDTRNDLMGGPFLACLTVFPSRKEILLQYAYVYRPNQPKRDLLLQMEAYMHSLQFIHE